MNPSDELRGQMVLIHPGLTNDPAGKPNRIGVITAAELENDNVYVGFGKGGQGLYGMDAVLILKNAAGIRQDLKEHRHEISTDDYKSLYKVALLQEMQSPAHTMKALELARDSNVVRNFSTITLEDALGLHMGQEMER